MSQTMNGHSLEENQWQRLKPISSAARQRCAEPGKELSYWPVWSKEELDGFNRGQDGSWQMKYRHCRECLTALSVAVRHALQFIFNLLPAFHIHTIFICSIHAAAPRELVGQWFSPCKTYILPLCLRYNFTFWRDGTCHINHTSLTATD